MNLDQLREFAKEFISKHPEHKQDVVDFVRLAEDEVADGESKWNECELAVNSINQLLEEEE